MGILTKIKSTVMISSSTKIASTAIAVAVLLGGMVGITYPAAFSSAESIVMRAAVETFTGQTSSVEEIFGTEEMTAAFQKQGAELSVETSVEKLPLGDLGLGNMTLSNVGFQLVAGITPQQEVSAVASVKVANTTLLSGNVYWNKNQLQFNVPKLFQSVLTLHYNDPAIEEKIKASYAAEYLGLTENSIEKFAEYLPKQIEPVSREEFRKKLLEILVTAYRSELNGTELTKAGKEELHGKDTVWECNVYAAELDAQRAGRFLDVSLTLVKDYIKEISGGYNITEQQVEEAFEDAFPWIYKIKENLRDTVAVKLYIYGNRIVKVTANWTMNVVKEEKQTTEPGSLVIEFSQEGNPAENMFLSVHTPIHQDAATKNVPQRLDLTYQVSTENTEADFSVNYNVKYNNTPQAFSFVYKKAGGDFTVKVTRQEQSFTLTGVVEKLTKGKKIGLLLDTCRTAEGIYVEEQKLNATVSFTVLKPSVAPLAGNQQDVLAMTEKEFGALEKEIKKNVTKLLFSMMGLFQ